MEHFVVSARKYRPQTFEDVVGQKAISNTLLNAIKNNHLAQALLFTGPRGVGKTSCARILAKTINEIEAGDNVEDTDFSFNIFELDAASNNSVDDIRNLTDQVRIPPQTGNYKVYIIDEVHMLSQSAFNAFLKTLEEPPKHAIFILATTEKHKIIPTILSRCQIFDFKRITVSDIKEHLKKIAETEGVNAEDDALHIIAQKADGAMRDALSTYDRVVSYCGTNLTRQAVTENLNVLDYETYFKITSLLLNHQLADVLISFNRILAKGFDGQHFISGLASHFRDLMVCQNQQTISLLEVGEQTKTRYFEQSQNASLGFLQEALKLANQCDFDYKLSRNQRLHVEICLMQLASLGAESQTAVKKKAKSYILSPDQVKAPEQNSSVAEVESTITNSQDVETDSAKPKRDKNQDVETSEVLTAASTKETSEEKNTPTSTPAASPTPQANTPLQDEDDTNGLSQEKTNSATAKPQETPSGLSLKAIRHKKALKAEKERLTAKKVEQYNEFTAQELLETWNNFAKQVKQSGQKIMASTFAMCKPTAKANMIHVDVPNDTMRAELLQQQGDLMTYLQQELKHSGLELQVNVVEQEEVQTKHLYTDREKYDQLVKTNPNLDKLRQTFDLDLRS